MTEVYLHTDTTDEVCDTVVPPFFRAYIRNTIDITKLSMVPPLNM